MPLGLVCISVYYTSAACNEVYFYTVCIVDSGYPSGQYLSIYYPVLLVIQTYHILMKIDMVCLYYQ